MPRDQEIKIVPSLPAQQTEETQQKPRYIVWLIVLIGIYFGLMLLVSFLPMPGYMRVLSLILGAFLVYDVHHSIKLYVRSKQ